jgi:hypothetical protein
VRVVDVRCSDRQPVFCNAGCCCCCLLLLVLQVELKARRMVEQVVLKHRQRSKLSLDDSSARALKVCQILRPLQGSSAASLLVLRLVLDLFPLTLFSHGTSPRATCVCLTCCVRTVAGNAPW